MAHIDGDAIQGDLASLAGDPAGLLIDPNDVHHAVLGRPIRTVKENPFSVRRPSRPPSLRPTSEKRQAPARLAPLCGSKPDIVGLFFMGVIGSPSAVRRPAERLILGYRRIHDA